MQCNFKTAAFAQRGDAKWAVSLAREYPPKAKQVAAAKTNKEFTKCTAIMLPGLNTYSTILARTGYVFF